MSFLLAAALAISQRHLPAQFSVPPILMYHRIDRARPHDDAIARDLTVSPENFALQLTEIKKLGLHTITLAQFDADLLAGRVPARSVIITFDDGYGDQFSNALPQLEKAHDKATFFIITSSLGTPGHLTWHELQTMSLNGQEIGGHGVTHDDLSTMSAAQQRFQIQTCLQTLRAFLLQPVVSYAYPSGRLNAKTLSIVAASGVDLAVTTDPAYVLPPRTRFEMTRLRVHGAWTTQDFAKALEVAERAPQTVRR